MATIDSCDNWNVGEEGIAVRRGGYEAGKLWFLMFRAHLRQGTLFAAQAIALLALAETARGDNKGRPAAREVAAGADSVPVPRVSNAGRRPRGLRPSSKGSCLVERPAPTAAPPQTAPAPTPPRQRIEPSGNPFAGGRLDGRRPMASSRPAPRTFHARSADATAAFQSYTMQGPLTTFGVSAGRAFPPTMGELEGGP